MELENKIGTKIASIGSYGKQVKYDKLCKTITNKNNTKLK
jgi:hypothetical protein